MFAITQKINTLTMQMQSLYCQVSSLANEVRKSNENVDGNEAEARSINLINNNERIDDVQKNLTKLQLDFMGKQGDLKKDIEKLVVKQEELKREIKILETTMSVKLEQLIVRLVKERVDQMIEGMKSCGKDICNDEILEEDYEINVTMTGENVEEEKPKRKGKKKTITVVDS